MRSTGGGPLPRRTLKPAQHWDWPSPTPYSQGLRCGPWLFVGGQAALDEDGNVVGAGNRAEQTELVIRYVAHVLGAAGACFDDVLKLNTYYCHSVGAEASQDHSHNISVDGLFCLSLVPTRTCCCSRPWSSW